METVFVIYYQNGRFYKQERIKKNFLMERKTFEKQVGFTIMVNINMPEDYKVKSMQKLLKEIKNAYDFEKVMKFLDLRNEYECL